MRGRGSAATALLVASAFLLLQLAWLLTMPPATGIDEFDHVHRAASVASGHWGYSHDEVSRSEGRGGLLPVPEDVVAATNPACETFHYVGPANCSAYADAGAGMVLVACAAARYNPAFYVLVGYPASLFHGTAALSVMRVVAALLCAAMLTLAALAVRTWARTGWPLLGLFLAATPTVLYSTSLAAPNGLNIASGLALWASLLGLVEADSTARTRRWLRVLAAVAAVVLVNTHTLGVVWLGLTVAAVAVQRGRLTLPRLAPGERRHSWLCLGAATLGATVAVGWILAAQTNSPASDASDFTGSWWHEVLTTGLVAWPLQAIAAFPMRDEPAPLAVYAIGLTMICCVAGLALRTLLRGRRVASLRAIAFVVAFSWAVPVVLTAASYQYIGLAWQGRYEMPFTGGLLLLFGLALDRSTSRLSSSVAAVVVGSAAVMNLLGQLRIVDYFAGSAVARATGWSAPAPLLLAALAAAAAGCAFLALRRAQPRAGMPERPAPEPVQAMRVPSTAARP